MDKNLEFRKKQAVLEMLFKEYRIAKFRLEENRYLIPSSSTFIIRENNGNDYGTDKKMISKLYQENYYEEFVNYIDHAIECLRPKDATLIRRSFFEQDPKWWMDYYTRPTYYRNRKKAINELYDILFPN